MALVITPAAVIPAISRNVHRASLAMHARLPVTTLYRHRHRLACAIPHRKPRLTLPPKPETLHEVGLWRSWERASMAWKRSSVRSRSGPPNNLYKSGRYRNRAKPLLLDVGVNAQLSCADPQRLRRSGPTFPARDHLELVVCVAHEHLCPELQRVVAKTEQAS